jgi:hypothetical protein
MGKRQRAAAAKSHSRIPKPLRKALVWVAVISLGAAFIYVLSENAGVPYDERAIAVVDFSSLDAKAKKTALQAANRARCNCGCGMQLAQCVATDSTCPIRAENIEKIKTMVREALPQSSSRSF